MKDPLVHEALRQIQDIFAEETGGPLTQSGRGCVERVLQSALGQLAGASSWEHSLTREVTILLADLRGFTAISAAHPANTVLDLLNRCFVNMSEIIFRHHGTIDKFMGDSILVLFEATRGDAVKNAVTCAVDMQCAMEAFNTINRAHEALLRWIEASGYRIAGPDREIYLHNTMPARRDDPSYVTELQYPIEEVASGQ